MTMSERPLQRPALDPAAVPEVRATTYPEPFKARLGDRAKRRLGEACGLTQFGVNLVTLGPGGQSALRHWHTHEDEFVYVLSGEVVLVTDAGEQLLRAGACAGYPAGSRNAHHMQNRSRAPAQYLEVGTRSAQDQALYPDDDLLWADRASGQPAPYGLATTVACHKDGKPYE
jgi:uncharacterized cupin superfamily protein